MATMGKAARLRQSRIDRERQRTEHALVAHREEIDALITSTGWAVCVNREEVPEGRALSLGYTIGRTLKGEPELAGLFRSSAQAQSVLNFAGASIDQGRAQAVPGQGLVLPGEGRWVLDFPPKALLEQMHYARERYTFIRVLALVWA